MFGWFKKEKKPDEVKILEYDMTVIKATAVMTDGTGHCINFVPSLSFKTTEHLDSGPSIRFVSAEDQLKKAFTYDRLISTEKAQINPKQIVRFKKKKDIPGNIRKLKVSVYHDYVLNRYLIEEIV